METCMQVADMPHDRRRCLRRRCDGTYWQASQLSGFSSEQATASAGV